jgi:coproporphyrinogen III oxidase
VLCVTTLGDNVKQAQKRAYDLIVGIHFDGMQYRRDIGHRASADERRTSQAGTGSRHRQRGEDDRPGPPQDYFTGLQTRLVAAARNARGQDGAQVPRRPLGKGSWLSARRQRLHLHHRGWPRLRARRRRFLARPRRRLPASATAKRPELAGCAFEAMGVSLVLHPENPYCPTAHMNVRALVATKADRARLVVWRRHGSDALLPLCGRHPAFPRHLQTGAAAFRRRHHARYKKWCDEYFFLKHRNEPRGVGGVFFDDLNEGGFERCFALTRAVGDAFTAAYLPIIEKRRPCPTANANAISRLTGADAMSSSTWSGIAARFSACSRAGEPSRS